MDYYNNSFPNVILLDNMSEMPQEAINKITMKVPMSAEEKVTNDFRREFPDLVPMASGFGALDVVLPNIDKAWGLKQIMTLFDISPDELMAFGDGDNDLAMLSLAYHSYAMENATERVKETARFIAPANTKSGVFQVIEAYLKEN
ncbi:HAD hydrolase family protein [Streptococcus gallolyticus]|uniref:HAD hydrolase family protein n=1 Tax=Streptococcus gallolyticus TaxID=315405 RepID=UPI0001E0D498|nr:HAD hydrolase family protein [Streptococcus gallolyticus]EFM29376.1 haloacid dehalogenase-like hydrolase [Streptococcus gallolyticus subsp. gallolyticus TX20005]